MKSRNGTFVNSQRIQSRVLKNNDIVVLGDYRIKVIAPAERAALRQEPAALGDTAKMKSVDDARELREQRAAEAAPSTTPHRHHRQFLR